MIGKTYRLIATLGLLHLLALGGGIGYLVGTGRLDAERARQIAEILGGESQEQAGAGEGESIGESEAARAASLGISPEQKQIREEVAWRNTERYRAEIEQRLRLINVARTDVTRQRDEFERLKEEQRRQGEEQLQREAELGYQRELEIISSLKPKAALQQIMSMSDADAARVMYEMEIRKTKKIVEAARAEAEQAKMTTVMRLIRDIKPGGQASSGQESTEGGR